MPICRKDCLQPPNSPPVEKRVLEFEGPVKIVLVDTELGSTNKKYSICVFMGYFAMGAVVMPVMFYSLAGYQPMCLNMHLLWCALGYHMYISSAYLSNSRWNGSTSLLKVEDRRNNYIRLKATGYLAIAFGTALASVKDHTDLSTSYNANYTLHSITGFCAGALGFVDMMTMPLTLFSRGKCCTRCTEIFGVPALVMATVSFICVIIENNRFRRQFIRSRLASYFFIAVLIYHTLASISSPVRNFIKCN